MIDETGQTMRFDRRRLIDAMATSIERISIRYGIPESDTDYLALVTEVGEFLRREQAGQVKSLYAAGYSLARRLAESIRRAQANTAGMEDFARLPATIAETSDYDSAQGHLDALKCALSLLVSGSHYLSDATGESQSIISSLCEWEGELLKVPSPAKRETEQEGDVRQMLESSARAQGGQFENATVVESTGLIGGFSNKTTLFKLADRKGEILNLVARASTGLELGIEGRDIGGEYHLLRYLYQGGVSVAEPMWLERDVGKYGAQFLVTRKIEGKNFGTVVDAARMNSSQLRSLATHLARIHALPLNEAHPDLQKSHIDTGLVSASMSQAVSNYLDRWISLWQSIGLKNSPTVAATMNWLRANLPQIEDAPVLVHGDYALHNIMMQGDEISGVLDWEMSHLGDSAEDIAGLLASFSAKDDAAEFMRYYLEAGGRAVTEFRLAYCNVFRYFMMYVVMLESQLRFYSLAEIHPGLLVLGSFVQTPSQRMAQAIENAEKAKARG